MLGFPLLYFKGVRLMMFQLSSFYCKSYGLKAYNFKVEGYESWNGWAW